MAERTSCHGCVYSWWEAGAWVRTVGMGWPAGPVCGNQPEAPGRVRECPRGEVCRNYRARPPVPQGESVRTIPLGDGVYAYVDAADYEWLSQWQWRLHGGYPARHPNRKGKKTVVFMHREIMRPPKGKIVDHISGNRCDNTRANLRNITMQENMQNKKKQAGASSIYKGVSLNRKTGRWRSQVNRGKESYFLGEFDVEVEAAKAYDHKAVEVFGEYARPNFPEEWPAAKRKRVHAKWLREQAKGNGPGSKKRGVRKGRRGKNGVVGG